MLVYILRRLMIMIPVLIGITILMFIIINLAPGDPIDAMIDPTTMVSGGNLEAKRVELGLDKPIVVRYFIWIGELLQGNLGYSHITNEAVADKIAYRIGPTLQFAGLSLLMAIFLGIPLGIISAVKQYSLTDYSLTVFAFTGISIPEFFVGLVAIYLFSLRLDIFPPYGLSGAGLNRLTYLILPAFSLGWARMSGYLRYTRSSMLEVLNEDYITTARAKGLKESVVILKHGFRNAMITIITIISLQLRALFGGSVIIETVFSIPGIGSMAMTGVTHRDYPVIMGVGLITALIVLLSNLLADILYAVVDPRIRY
jgi:peptide/nickel transport system permease protein